MNRFLRGGARRALFFRDDTDEVVDTEALLADGGEVYRPTAEYEPTAAGTRRPASRTHELALVIPDRGAVERLEAWGRAKVRALVLGSPLGVHRIWDEPARLELEPRDAAFGSLAGHVVCLFSARYAASVAFSDDLLALSSWTDNGDGTKTATRVLPAPGLRLYAYALGASGQFDASQTVTIEVTNASGGALTTDADAHPTVVLPDGAWSVSVTAAAGVRPVLTTKPAAPGFAIGGFWLVQRATGAAVLEPYGEATAPSERYTVTYRGIQYERASALLGPAGVMALRAAADDEPGRVLLTTTPKSD